MARIRTRQLKDPFTYGRHPNPQNWWEAADALRALIQKANRSKTRSYRGHLAAVHKGAKGNLS